MLKPMFVLHKDESGNVLAANSFDADYQLSSWLRERDFRAGDRLEFHEAVKRPRVRRSRACHPSIHHRAAGATGSASDCW
jgi:hypothetical protein